ncbi:hypothetical protein CPB84DRAFT_1763221 [Gymnopilus junonius]|uniref:Uncharacterized protein n=1 Tax=Gymnopilus junonius TaxID=109634 RepID=A0A9P5NWL0_GYMJU|nr:hypothetical protein CPB84DRAFT_1763221 [Gymnopilus junonius]
MTKVIGFDPTWEQIRFKYVQLYYRSRFTYSRTHVFQPGHIAYGQGSIEAVFYSRLFEMGFKLLPREMPSGGDVPKRYCIVNRHIEGQKYEVFLLTTFGGAKNEVQLSPMGRYFGMPMGSTQWVDDTPGLATIPPLFGREKASFAFVIPTISVIERPNLPTLTRLPYGELQRLRKFSHLKLQALPDVQAELRRAMRNQLYKREAPVSYVDDFKPLPMEKMNSIVLEEDDLEDNYYLRSTFSPSTPKRIRMPIRNDIKWPLQYFYQDINGSKSLIHRPHTLLRLAPIPRPYYAPCLPISVKKFKQLIR